MTAVEPSRRALLGAEVLDLGSTPIDEALERVGTVVPADSDFGRKHKRTFHVTSPTILRGLDLIEDPEVLPLRVRDVEARIRSMRLEAVDHDGSSDWYKRSLGAPVDSFVTLYDLGEGPLPRRLASLEE